MRNSTTYNKIVNFDAATREISILEDVFSYGENFKGATGCVLVLVSREEYENTALDVDYVTDYLMDAMCFEDIPESYQREGGFRSFAEDIIDAGDDVIYDESFAKLWDDIREELNLSEEDAYIFNCISCGRIFGKSFAGNMNTDLSAVIREFEA